MRTQPGMSPASRLGRTVLAVMRELRPEQWTKNLVVGLPFLFGGVLRAAGSPARALLGVAVFCVLSGAVYLVNDIADARRDRLHPVKKDRPIARGELSVGTAARVAAALLALALSAAWILEPRFFAAAGLYAAVMLGYSAGVKRVPFLEVVVVASGIPLRALAGAALARVPPSPMLLLCAFLLALFLVVAKRRYEAGLAAASPRVHLHRSTLRFYSLARVDRLLAVIALATVAAYATYTMLPETAAKFHGRSMAPTVPLVLVGVVRYVLLVSRGAGGNPSRELLDDPTLLAVTAAWAALAGWIVYH